MGEGAGNASVSNPAAAVAAQVADTVVWRPPLPAGDTEMNKAVVEIRNRDLVGLWPVVWAAAECKAVVAQV